MKMRTAKWSTILALSVLAISLVIVSSALAQPRMMAEDVFTPLTKGYDLMRDGKYEAAEYQFKDALSRDRYNPFALNNLAVLQERAGKLKDALAYLNDAKAHAAEYFDQVEQTCFVDGLCSAVKPQRKMGTKSTIAPIIDENYQKLQEKISKTPMSPEPSTAPRMK